MRPREPEANRLIQSAGVPVPDEQLIEKPDDAASVLGAAVMPGRSRAAGIYLPTFEHLG